MPQRKVSFAKAKTEKHKEMMQTSLTRFIDDNAFKLCSWIRNELDITKLKIFNETVGVFVKKTECFQCYPQRFFNCFYQIEMAIAGYL